MFRELKLWNFKIQVVCRWWLDSFDQIIHARTFLSIDEILNLRICTTINSEEHVPMTMKKILCIDKLNWYNFVKKRFFNNRVSSSFFLLEDDFIPYIFLENCKNLNMRKNVKRSFHNWTSSTVILKVKVLHKICQTYWSFFTILLNVNKRNKNSKSSSSRPKIPYSIKNRKKKIVQRVLRARYKEKISIFETTINSIMKQTFYASLSPREGNVFISPPATWLV